MKQPFFTIVMPNYNSSKTILKTIGSIKEQSFQDFELIIVDDHSKDNSIIKISHTFKNSKIKIIKLNKNGGPAKARNIGIKKSRGKYIAFVDSDDLWFRNKLKEMHFCIISNKANVYCHNELSKSLDETKKIIKNGPFTKDFYYNLLTNQNCLSTSAVIIEKFFIQKNKLFFNEDRSFFSVEDYDYWMRLAQKKAKFLFINKILGIYNFTEDSISSNYYLHYKNTLNVLKYHCFKLKKFKNGKKIYNKASFRFKINYYKFEILKKKDLIKIFKIMILILLNPLISIQHFRKKFVLLFN